MSKPTSVSPENKAVARHAARCFGGEPHVTEHVHDTVNLSVGILWSANRPVEGVTSYSTVRLSDSIMLKDGLEFPTRLELAGACASDQRDFPNVLAAAAFCVMRTQRLLHPGAILRDYVAEYFPRTTVPHLYFTAPFLWGECLNRLELETKRVSWLLAVPVSEAEARYLHEYGDIKLEQLFEERSINIYDLQRSSVV